MPRAQKQCGVDGCRVLVPGGTRCPQHRHRFTNGSGRTSTAEHRAWRAAVLRTYGRVCFLQIPGICIGKATEADHIVPVARGGAEFDVNNGQPACSMCHRHKSSYEGHAARGHSVPDDDPPF